MNRSFFAFVFASIVACTSQVALEDRPCPCATGWVCCASNNVCVAEGAQCPTGQAPGTDASSTTDAPASDGGPTTGTGTIELATAQSARCLTTDRDHVYWQNADGLVVGNSKRGGQLEVSHFRTPLANNDRCGLAVDGDELYATAFEFGKILVLPLSSNGKWTIGASGSMFGELTTPSSLALDADAIYVTEYEVGRVTRQPRTRAAAIVLAEGLVRPHGIATDGSFVYFAERGDDTNVGAIKRVAKTCGAVDTLAPGQKFPAGLSAWDGRLYWVAEGKLRSVSTQGGAVTDLAGDAFSFAPGPVVDGTFVYYPGLSRVAKVPFAGGASIPTAIDVYTSALAVDETRLFWADATTVFSAPK